MYPVMLDVSEKKCLVVGGGAVAARKAEGLVAEGAKVTVLAPEPCERLISLSAQGQISLHERAYQDGEASSAYALVFAATDDRAVNRRVFEDADQAGVWANVADDPELCSFHLPARVRLGALQMSVSSDGRAPFAVRRVRKLLEKRMGESWRAWAECAEIFREKVRQQTTNSQNALFDEFFSRTVDEEQLLARSISESEMDELISGLPSAEGAKPMGFVSLVGAGPGDPGLLTLRAMQRLVDCDAVVYDRLALPALPGMLSDRIEMHPVGKQAHRHPVPQREINALLVQLAKEGKMVVRFKGGDPFVFGRGSEEAMALVDAGVPFEVVPGVTAGIAAPACAGIPVTHREKSVRLTLVTGHESDKADGPQVRWDLLANDHNGTLVGYMSVGNLPNITKTLKEAGMDQDTPAALIHRGCTGSQSVLTSTLGKLADDAKEAGVAPPAVFVIGPTVGLSKTIDWFSKRPLVGKRMLVFHRDEHVANALDLAGAEVLRSNMPIGKNAKALVKSMSLNGVVFTSAWQVQAMDESDMSDELYRSAQAFCSGPDTLRAAKQVGWKDVKEFSYDSEGLSI